MPAPKKKKPDPYALDTGAKDPAAPAASTAASGARFDAERHRSAHVITFSRPDVLDAAYIEQLGQDLRAFALEQPRPWLVIDLGNVHHLSSAALGMLVALKSTVDGKGGSINLANVHDNLRQIFKITKLHKVLKIHDSIDAAVAALK